MILAGPVGRAFVNQQLDKGALLGGEFPGGGAFAGSQPDDRATDADGLAGPQFEIPGQAVALVQKAERGNPFRHRRSDLLRNRCDQIPIGCSNFSFFSRLAGGIFLDIVVAEPATARQQQHGGQHRKGNGVAQHAGHSASAGFQDS